MLHLHVTAHLEGRVHVCLCVDVHVWRVRGEVAVEARITKLISPHTRAS